MVEGSEGLSLEGLAKRLEALERENERMRSENARLWGEIATPRARGAAARKAEPDGIEMPDVSEGRVSRKVLLAKAGAAVVAVAAAGTMLSPREAKAATVVGSGNPGVDGLGTQNGATGVRGEIIVGLNGDGVQGYGDGSGFHGVFGSNLSSGGIGVYGQGQDGVQGVSNRDGSSGVYGKHSFTTVGHGILGEGKGQSYSGVLGKNDTGTGVWGKSLETGYAAVFGQHLGTAGYGVVGDGTGNGVGVLGRNPSGAGLEGRNSRYGGRFDGERAQLVLVPKRSVGKPTSGSHTKGEIYLDSAASVFVCTKSGTPGTWRKVTTTAT